MSVAVQVDRYERNSKISSVHVMHTMILRFHEQTDIRYNSILHGNRANSKPLQRHLARTAKIHIYKWNEVKTKVENNKRMFRLFSIQKVRLNPWHIGKYCLSIDKHQIIQNVHSAMICGCSESLAKQSN